AGGKYFYQKSLPGEAFYKLYYRTGEKGQEILLFDPQTFIAGKTIDYLARVSDDGSRLLLIISEAGGELGDIHIMDVATKKFYPDVIPHARGRFVAGSNTDIVYLEYASKDPHNTNNILNCPFKLHVMGTPVTNDIVLASGAKYPELNFKPVERPWVSFFKNSPYMILETNSGGDIPVFYALKSELKKEKINWKQIAGFDDEIKEFFVHESEIYLLTSKGNPKFKIIKTSLVNPNLSNAEIVAEGKGDWKISSVSATKDYLLINFSKNEIITQPKIYSFVTGKTEEVKTSLKGNSSLSVLSAADNEIEIFNTGWNVPFNRYRYDIEKKTVTKGLYHLEYNGIFPQLNNLVYEEIDVPSPDGVMVPLSIFYNKALLKKDGTNGCVITGYGAYGANAGAPYFEASVLPMVNRGYVMAIAHVRGGGEKGNDWHMGGKKITKPNTWKDYNACADWLINNKYTSSQKIAGLSASAGGILIGRAITERPDLYKAVICHVGVLNALRVEFMPSGPSQIAEFGSVKDSVEFKSLLEMDAYHHTQPGIKYPAQLFSASFKDFRVPAYMPAKFAAKMQTANSSENPVLLHVDFEGGHFGSSNQENAIKQLAKEWSFLFWQTGHPDFQPVK
ncbi:MAG: prolyl oligopeptidase family serine peptidase, partial [Chitinophagaceae bacterium]